MSIDRFTLWRTGNAGMHEDEHGHWVKHSDHTTILAAKDEEIGRLKELVKELEETESRHVMKICGYAEERDRARRMLDTYKNEAFAWRDARQSGDYRKIDSFIYASDSQSLKESPHA